MCSFCKVHRKCGRMITCLLHFLFLLISFIILPTPVCCLCFSMFISVKLERTQPSLVLLGNMWYKSSLYINSQLGLIKTAWQHLTHGVVQVLNLVGCLTSKASLVLPESGDLQNSHSLLPTMLFILIMVVAHFGSLSKICVTTNQSCLPLPRENTHTSFL